MLVFFDFIEEFGTSCHIKKKKKIHDSAAVARQEMQ